MKWFSIALALTVGQVAFADECEKSCEESAQMCADQCKKALKKDHADKINFCSEKCKEFNNDCKKECQDEKKG